MHSLWGRPTRSHTVLSPSPYILVASARATVATAGLNVGRGCPGGAQQHPVSSHSTPTYVGPPLFPRLRGLLMLLLLPRSALGAGGSWSLRRHLPDTRGTPVSASLAVGRSENDNFNLRWLNILAPPWRDCDLKIISKTYFT